VVFRNLLSCAISVCTLGTVVVVPSAGKVLPPALPEGALPESAVLEGVLPDDALPASAVLEGALTESALPEGTLPNDPMPEDKDPMPEDKDPMPEDGTFATGDDWLPSAMWVPVNEVVSLAIVYLPALRLIVEYSLCLNCRFLRHEPGSGASGFRARERACVPLRPEACTYCSSFKINCGS
jgi:hypothetical protein